MNVLTWAAASYNTTGDMTGSAPEFAMIQSGRSCIHFGWLRGARATPGRTFVGGGHDLSWRGCPP